MTVYAGTEEIIARAAILPNLPPQPFKGRNDTETLNNLFRWTNELLRALASTYFELSLRTNVYMAVRGSSAFGAAAVTAAVVFDRMPDPDYIPLMIPSWNAVLWWTAKTETGFTINASAAPGGSGGTVLWVVVP